MFESYETRLIVFYADIACVNAKTPGWYAAWWRALVTPRILETLAEQRALAFEIRRRQAGVFRFIGRWERHMGGFRLVSPPEPARRPAGLTTLTIPDDDPRATVSRLVDRWASPVTTQRE